MTDRELAAQLHLMAKQLAGAARALEANQPRAKHGEDAHQVLRQVMLDLIRIAIVKETNHEEA